MTTRYTITISPAGDVTLRTPAGRSVAWHGAPRHTPDAAAREHAEALRVIERQQLLLTALF